MANGQLGQIGQNVLETVSGEGNLDTVTAIVHHHLMVESFVMGMNQCNGRGVRAVVNQVSKFVGLFCH